MKKPPLDGMAISESLYSFEESETASKISDPQDLNKCESLKSFLQTDFEHGRPMPDDPYEREKRVLDRYPLSADEIEVERKAAARRCRV
jgi:hypothetical protein